MDFMLISQRNEPLALNMDTQHRHDFVNDLSVESTGHGRLPGLSILESCSELPLLTADTGLPPADTKFEYFYRLTLLSVLRFNM